MNTDVDPPETDAGATVDDVRKSMNEVPSSVVSDAVIVQKLEAAEEYIQAIAKPSATTAQIRQAEIARAALKTFGSEASVKQKQAADVSKTWDTSGLRSDLETEFDDWLEIITDQYPFYSVS